MYSMKGEESPGRNQMNKIALVVFMFLLNACAGSSDKNNSSSDNSGLGTSGSSLMNGSWSKGCMASGGSSDRSVTQFINGSSVSKSFHYNTTTDCSGTADSTATMKMTYTVVGASHLGSDIFEVDSTFTSATIGYTSQAAIDFINGISLCGYNDWVVGVEKEVTGRLCGAFTQPAVNLKTYGIVKLSGNQLSTGNSDGTHDGTTADKRTVTLDPTPYLKQ